MIEIAGGEKERHRPVPLGGDGGDRPHGLSHAIIDGDGEEAARGFSSLEAIDDDGKMNRLVRPERVNLPAEVRRRQIVKCEHEAAVKTARGPLPRGKGRRERHDLGDQPAQRRLEPVQ